MGNEFALDDKFSGMKLVSNELAHQMDLKDKLKKELKEVEGKIKEHSAKLLTLMRADDLTGFKSPRGSFYINTATRCRVTEPLFAFEFLRSIGCEGLIKETVSAASLSSTMKELMEKGEVMLTDLESKGIGVYVDESVRIRGRDSAE